MYYRKNIVTILTMMIGSVQQVLGMHHVMRARTLLSCSSYMRNVQRCLSSKASSSRIHPSQYNPLNRIGSEEAFYKFCTGKARMKLQCVSYDIRQGLYPASWRDRLGNFVDFVKRHPFHIIGLQGLPKGATMNNASVPLKECFWKNIALLGYEMVAFQSQNSDHQNMIIFNPQAVMLAGTDYDDSCKVEEDGTGKYTRLIATFYPLMERNGDLITSRRFPPFHYVNVHYEDDSACGVPKAHRFAAQRMVEKHAGIVCVAGKFREHDDDKEASRHGVDIVAKADLMNLGKLSAESGVTHGIYSLASAPQHEIGFWSIEYGSNSIASCFVLTPK